MPDLPRARIVTSPAQKSCNLRGLTADRARAGCDSGGLAAGWPQHKAKGATMNQRVTVLLPTFNRAGLIGETLDSLLGQTRLPDEIIVIDDGSEDATPEVLAGYGERITVLRKQNAGKAAALNDGLARARGDLIWINDDDDLILPETCARLAGALEADPGLDFCAGRHEDFEVNPKTGARDHRAPGYWRPSQPDEIFPDLLEGCHIFQPGLMVRRAVYDRVGPFRTDLTRSQDYEMILRIARHHRGRVLPELAFLHREHKGARGSAGERFAAQQNADRWKVFNHRIFSALLADLDDAELFDPVQWQGTAPEARPRLAAIKRGCVMARQRMWIEALPTWRDAVLRDTGPFSPAEIALLHRSTTSPLGAPELFDDPAVRLALRDLSRCGPRGQQILRVLQRSTRWQLRRALQRREWLQSARIMRFLIPFS